MVEYSQNEKIENLKNDPKWQRGPHFFGAQHALKKTKKMNDVKFNYVQWLQRNCWPY